MRFRPASSSTVAEAPAPFQSSASYASPSPRKKGRKFPLKVLSPGHTRINATTSSVESSKKEPRSAKRRKSQVPEEQPPIHVEYPVDVPVPSRTTIKALYEHALENPDSYQSTHLQGTGLLSLEDVLLPAVLQKEVQALKQMQAKAQRDDDSEQSVVVLQACRHVLYETAQVGLEAAQTARRERQDAQVQRLQQQEEERRRIRQDTRQQLLAERRERREEAKRVKAVEKQHERQSQKKKLPKNVEIWREVTQLMIDLAKLEKEERLWKRTDEALKEREADLVVRETEERQREASRNEQESVQEPQEHELQADVEQAVRDVTLSSIRVEQSVALVEEVVGDADEVRKALYDEYRKEHQFHGYKGVKNPKALIRAIAMQ